MVSQSGASVSWFEYAGSTALITGASRGIGAALAESLARRKADLVLVARSPDALRALAERITREHGVRCVCLDRDLSMPNAAADIAEELRRRQLQIDLLINNAGLGLTGAFLTHAIAAEEGEIQLNVQTLVGLAHRLGGAMAERGRGGIVNLASNASFQPLPWMATYAATKAFVLHFSEALHHELAASGVHVMASCPGPTATDFFGSSTTGAHFTNADSPRRVADNTLDAFDRKKAIAYPGRFSVRLTTWLPRLLPRSLAVRAAAMAMREMGAAEPPMDRRPSRTPG